MSDVSLSLQQQVTQAINQLNKLAADNPSLQRGVDILVQRLTNDQVTLANPRTNQQVTLPNSFSGNASAVSSGAQMSGRLAQQSGQQVLVLNEPSNSQTGANLQRSLQTLTADNVMQIMQRMAGATSNSATSVTTVNARVLGVQGNQITVQLGSAGGNQQLTLDVPPQQSLPKVGQNVTIQLLNRGGELTARLLDLANPASTSADKPQPGQPKQVAGNTSVSQLLGSAASTSGLTISTGKRALTTALSGLLDKQQLGDLKTLMNAIPSNKVDVTIRADAAKNTFSLAFAGLAAKPVQAAALPLTESTLRQLQSVFPGLTASASANAATQTQVSQTQSPPAQMLNAEGVKQLLQTNLQALTRQALPLADSPTQALQQIVAALSDTQGKTADTTALLNQLKQLIQAGSIQGSASDDVPALRALLSASPLPITPTNITQPVSQQGIMAGITALVQSMLSARMARSQPAGSERLANALMPFLTSTTGRPVNTRNTRTQQELSQLDQRHNLLKGIGKLLASHQQNKLGHMENMLQGQESMYYVLPNGQGEQRKDIELMIRREPDPEKHESNQQEGQRTWHLTMKLPAGDLGEMLAKARLTAEELELDFYTSSESLKLAIMNFLPLLKKRLDGLGITVNKAHCQLGKIPATLAERPYSILETQA